MDFHSFSMMSFEVNRYSAQHRVCRKNGYVKAFRHLFLIDNIILFQSFGSLKEFLIFHHWLQDELITYSLFFRSSKLYQDRILFLWAFIPGKIFFINLFNLFWILTASGNEHSNSSKNAHKKRGHGIDEFVEIDAILIEIIFPRFLIIE